MRVNNKMIIEVSLDLSKLKVESFEVYEEPSAHISLHQLKVMIRRHYISAGDKETVFEQTASSDEFQISGCDEFLVEMHK